jgi:hypothetical protein
MFEPDYRHCLIVYVTVDLSFFDLGYFAAIYSLFVIRVSLMARRNPGLEAANNKFCDTGVGHHFCVEVENDDV